MPLDQQTADKVVFLCELCGQEQGVRKMQTLNGGCAKCGFATWRMEITFVETESPPTAVLVASAAFGLVGGLLAGMAMGAPAHSEKQTIHMVTPKVPPADAAEIAGFGWGYKQAACRYREMRQDLDAAADRENQKAQGARNCLKCNYFFVPAPGKPWTQVGYCSPGCFGSANMAGEVPAPPPIASQPPPVEVKPTRTIAAVCKKGHAFEVAAMYAGTMRPCPVCQEKTPVC